MIKKSAIVAYAQNRTIGNNNTLPWHLPEDLKHFKTHTMGKPLIMGRLTFDSLGKPLPGRPHIVITRQPHWSYPGVHTAHSLEQAFEIAEGLAEAEAVDEIMVIGGAKIYHQALPLLDVLYATEIQSEVDGDAWFPELEKEQWREQARSGPYKSEKGGLGYAFVIYERQKPV